MSRPMSDLERIARQQLILEKAILADLFEGDTRWPDEYPRQEQRIRRIERIIDCFDHPRDRD